MSDLEYALNSDVSKALHVMPIGDYREHESSASCWCSPSQDDEEPRLYIHHSMDGREAYENGRKLS